MLAKTQNNTARVCRYQSHFNSLRQNSVVFRIKQENSKINWRFISLFCGFLKIEQTAIFWPFILKVPIENEGVVPIFFFFLQCNK